MKKDLYRVSHRTIVMRHTITHTHATHTDTRTGGSMNSDAFHIRPDTVPSVAPTAEPYARPTGP